MSEVVMCNFKVKTLFSFILVMVLCVALIGYSGVRAEGESAVSTPSRPKISVKVNDSDVKITIKKTEGAEGYYIYLKAPGDKKYTKSVTIKKDGTAKRKYTFKNLGTGSYKVKVRAYAGSSVSSFSKVKTFEIAGEMPDQGGSTEAKDIVILFTSDVHCGINNGFTYAGLTAVRDSLKAAGNEVILVDNGDSIQGEPIGTLSRGEAIIKLMNAAGYEVAIPGNHEYDYGMDRFFELTDIAKFPYISCNFNKEGQNVFKPYIIKELGGKKIAFVGVTTPLTVSSSTPKYFQNEEGEFIYGFLQDGTGEKLYNAVQKAVDDAKAEGADNVILMAHLGNEAEASPWTYVEVIANTTGIDVLLDGHSHDSDKALVKNKDGNTVLRQGCGTKLESIGWTKLGADGSIDTGLYTWPNKDNVIDVLGINNEMTELLSASEKEFGEALKKVIGKTEVELTINDPVAKDAEGRPIRIVRCAETNLGDFCADAYRDQSGADVALVNGGGVRLSIPQGDITYEDILKVHPFGNKLTVCEVTGQQLLDALEWGCRSMPASTGGFLQVSGISFEVHTYLDSSCKEDANGMFAGISGEYRVKNVMVGNEPLDKNKKYTVASSNYLLLEDGDGYVMFEGAALLQDSVKLDNQVLIDYLTGTLNGVVGSEYSNPYGTGRIVAVEEK